MQGNSPRQITKKLRQGKLRLNWYTVDNMQHIKRWRESRKCITGDCDMRQSTRCDVCSVHSTNRVCHTQNNTSGLLKTEQVRFDWEANTGDQNYCVKEIRHTKERKGNYQTFARATYIFTSHEQRAVHNQDMKTTCKSFEDVARYQPLRNDTNGLKFYAWWN
jgi:hypothetical protein